MKFGLCGASYVPWSTVTDSEVTMNFVPQLSESENAKTPLSLYSTPGLGLFGTLPKSPTRGQFAINDRKFALGDRFFVVAGDSFYEVFHDGDHQERGTVVTGSTPVSMSSNGFEVLIVCEPGAPGAPNVFLYSLESGAFAPVDALTDANVIMATQLGGYFVAMMRDSREFRISALNDGATWDPADVGVKQGGGDNLASIFADHDELVLLGTRTMEIWSNTGAADFPFQRIQGAFIEQGAGAQWAPLKLDNSFMWIGGDDRGSGVVWRAQGYTPVRISNHAVENAIQNYATLADAEGYAYQWGGQMFAVWRFPSAQATWVYDVSTKLWHQRGWWDLTQGIYLAHRGRFHSFVYGKHILGDWGNGKLYWQHPNFYDDAGNPIRRMRISPHVENELKILTHSQVVLDMEVGMGGSPREPIWNEMTQQWQEVSDTWDSLRSEGGVDPKVMMSYSDDGGKTYGPEQWRSAGKAGEYRTILRWGRLGSSYRRVYKFVISDPFKCAIADGYAEIRKGTR